ncbi:hypothetical protein BDR03DRAFT_1017957 [Suillus americanus]|nr:hypothetical protein BDR03DRAFT_1017957 [Suillus americanus]
MDTGRNVQESSSLVTSHDIDTDRQPMLEVDDMQNSIDCSLESVDNNLNVVCSAVESAPQAVFDTMDGDHIVDESITTIDALLIQVERQSMSQFFQSAARGLSLTGLRVDCAIQCDADSAGESPDQVHLCSNDDSINHQESDLVVIPEVKDAACIQDSSEPPQMESDCAIEHVSTTSPRSLDPSFTLDIKQPCMGSDDWMTVAVESGIDLLDCIAHNNSKHKDAVSEFSPVDNLAVHGRLRPRKLKDGKPRATFAKTRHRGNSLSEHDVIVIQQGSGCPIIYARSQLQSNSKKQKASPAIKYTLDDLMKESRKDHKDIPPYIHSFLIDPKCDAFIESNISAKYHLLLDVARFVASTLSKKSLSDTLMPSALSLMKIEYWLHDVAEDCKKALEADDITLSHLAQHGLIELSKRASIDAVSLSAALKIYMLKHQNSFKAFSTVTRYLCKLQVSHPGADIQYEPGFKVLARMITALQNDM